MSFYDRNKLFTLIKIIFPGIGKSWQMSGKDPEKDTGCRGEAEGSSGWNG